MISYAREKCIHCGQCTRQCPFLSHYAMDLEEFTRRPNLRGECYLCDNCKRVCPKKISGREIAMAMRATDPLPSRKVRFQKNPYLLRNLQKCDTKTLLYLGCNYPGQYPETVKKLISICADRGVDFSVDCCKKPIEQLGRPLSRDTIFDTVKNRGIKRLVCCCPNCYTMMKDRSDIEIISVYDYLDEEGLLHELPEEDIPAYIPCGDRENLDFFQRITPYLKSYHTPYESIHCCGLGGGGKHNPTVEKTIKTRFQAINRKEKSIWTYCASCSIRFNAYSLEGITNFLSAFLGIYEPPSKSYAKNIVFFRRYPHGK
ncbi:MAG: (Fe-S)-binding protein [Peptoniphilus sp.]|nr:(Fe-S)-binding protein [Peptoniphilus sp.]MDY3118459.1 (Fe-S)-binding protein [Peptoniphilus sp.]